MQPPPSLPAMPRSQRSHHIQIPSLSISAPCRRQSPRRGIHRNRNRCSEPQPRTLHPTPRCLSDSIVRPLRPPAPAAKASASGTSPVDASTVPQSHREVEQKSRPHHGHHRAPEHHHQLPPPPAPPQPRPSAQSPEQTSAPPASCTTARDDSAGSPPAPCHEPLSAQTAARQSTRCIGCPPAIQTLLRPTRKSPPQCQHPQDATRPAISAPTPSSAGTAQIFTACKTPLRTAIAPKKVRCANHQSLMRKRQPHREHAQHHHQHPVSNATEQHHANHQPKRSKQQRLLAQAGIGIHHRKRQRRGRQHHRSHPVIPPYPLGQPVNASQKHQENRRFKAQHDPRRRPGRRTIQSQHQTPPPTRGAQTHRCS